MENILYDNEHSYASEEIILNALLISKQHSAQASLGGKK